MVDGLERGIRVRRHEEGLKIWRRLVFSKLNDEPCSDMPTTSCKTSSTLSPILLPAGGSFTICQESTNSIPSCTQYK